MPNPRCPFCQKKQKTAGSVNQHITRSRKCHRKWRDSLAGDSFGVSEDEAEDNRRSPSPIPSDEDEDDPMGIADDFVYPAPAESPPSPEPIQPSQRATVEEVPDEGDPENYSRFVECFENKAHGRSLPGRPLKPGETLLKAGDTLFQRMHAQQTAKDSTPFSPFRDDEEWDLARWLMKNVTQTGTDEYLALPIVGGSY